MALITLLLVGEGRVLALRNVIVRVLGQAVYFNWSEGLWPRAYISECFC